MQTFPSQPETESPESESQWSLLSVPTRLHTLALPIAFGLNYLLAKWGLTSMLGWYFVSIPLHEIGHAVGAWLGSRFAFPIGALIPMAGFTTMSDERSVFFGLFVFAGIASLGWQGFRKSNRTLLILAALLAFLWIRFTFFVPLEVNHRFSIWSGVGGEFFLGAGLVILCFYELPPRFHWEFFRMIALFYGSYSYVASFSKWLAIRAKEASLPMGSFLSGGADSNGDMERLMQVYGWTEPKIIQSYVQLGTICGLLIAGHWIYALSRRLRTSQR